MPCWSSLSFHFSSVLRTISSPSSLRHGEQIHARALTFGLLPDATLDTDLLLMYSRCSFSDLSLARRLFDQMPHRTRHAWNILLSSYTQSSLYDSTLCLLRPFFLSGLRPDHFTLPALCKACAGCELSSLGSGLHGWAIKLGLDGVVFVSSSIVDMYAKLGSLEDAYKLFGLMPDRDVVVWNSLISGFARAGRSAESLYLFQRLQLEGLEMDWRAVPSILCACGREGDCMRGKEVHVRAIKSLVFNSDVAVGNALIDMYGKCGCLNYASKVFACVHQRNTVTWSTMISCLGAHGRGEESLKLYREMIKEGFKPNCITFTSILSSCSHSGLIDEGQRIFETMSTVYGVKPTSEHYACMADLLGRSGNIIESRRLIEKMPMEPGPVIWGALLAACAAHKNTEIGEIVARKLFELEPENASNYIALCGIYVAAGNSDGVSRIRSRMRELGMSKTPGKSWILLKGKLHAFYQGKEISHPFARRICRVLQNLHSVSSTIASFEFTAQPPC